MDRDLHFARARIVAIAVQKTHAARQKKSGALKRPGPGISSIIVPPPTMAARVIIPAATATAPVQKPAGVGIVAINPGLLQRQVKLQRLNRRDGHDWRRRKFGGCQRQHSRQSHASEQCFAHRLLHFQICRDRRQYWREQSGMAAPPTSAPRTGAKPAMRPALAATTCAPATSFETPNLSFMKTYTIPPETQATKAMVQSQCLANFW